MTTLNLIAEAPDEAILAQWRYWQTFDGADGQAAIAWREAVSKGIPAIRRGDAIGRFTNACLTAYRQAKGDPHYAGRERPIPDERLRSLWARAAAT